VWHGRQAAERVARTAAVTAPTKSQLFQEAYASSNPHAALGAPGTATTTGAGNGGSAGQVMIPAPASSATSAPTTGASAPLIAGAPASPAPKPPAASTKPSTPAGANKADAAKGSKGPAGALQASGGSVSKAPPAQKQQQPATADGQIWRQSSAGNLPALGAVPSSTPAVAPATPEPGSLPGAGPSGSTSVAAPSPAAGPPVLLPLHSAAGSAHNALASQVGLVFEAHTHIEPAQAAVIREARRASPAVTYIPLKPQCSCSTCAQLVVEAAHVAAAHRNAAADARGPAGAAGHHYTSSYGRNLSGGLGTHTSSSSVQGSPARGRPFSLDSALDANGYPPNDRTSVAGLGSGPPSRSGAAGTPAGLDPGAGLASRRAGGLRPHDSLHPGATGTKLGGGAALQGSQVHVVPSRLATMAGGLAHRLSNQGVIAPGVPLARAGGSYDMALMLVQALSLSNGGEGDHAAAEDSSSQLHSHHAGVPGTMPPPRGMSSPGTPGGVASSFAAGAVTNAALVAGSGPAQILASRARGGTPARGGGVGGGLGTSHQPQPQQQQQGRSGSLWGSTTAAAGGGNNTFSVFDKSSASVFDKSSAARLDLDGPSPRVSGGGNIPPLIPHPSSPSPYTYPGNREGSSHKAAGRRAGTSSSTPQMSDAVLPSHMWAQQQGPPRQGSPGKKLSSPHTSITITATAAGPSPTAQVQQQQQHNHTSGALHPATAAPATPASLSYTPAPSVHSSLRFEDIAGLLQASQHMPVGESATAVAAGAGGGGAGMIWSVYKDMPVVAPPTLATTAANRSGASGAAGAPPAAGGAAPPGGGPAPGPIHPASTIAKQVSEASLCQLRLLVTDPLACAVHLLLSGGLTSLEAIDTATPQSQRLHMQGYTMQALTFLAVLPCRSHTGAQCPLTWWGRGLACTTGQRARACLQPALAGDSWRSPHHVAVWDFIEQTRQWFGVCSHGVPTIPGVLDTETCLCGCLC
jgi:hypothetical protein